MKADRIVTLALLAAFVAYGWQVYSIELLPFERNRPFRPDTFPSYLAVFGALFCVAVLFSPSAGEDGLAKDAHGWRGFDWRRFFLFILLLLAYATCLRPLGYLGSTFLFLTLGGLLLGERRVLLLTGVAAFTALLTWYLVDVALDIYLLPWPEALGR